MIIPEKIIRFKAFRKKNPPLTLYINIKSFLWEFFTALQGNKHGVIIEQMSKFPDLKTMNPFGSDSTITKNINWKTEVLRQLNTKFTGKQFMVR